LNSLFYFHSKLPTTETTTTLLNLQENVQDMSVRPDVNIGDDVHQVVRDYAKREGYNMPRAWAELIKEGLRSEDAMNS